MRKLLIAEHSETRIESLQSALRSDWEIYTCMDSCSLIDTLERVRPDALIINLNIGPKDGLAALRDCFPHLPPVILALTNFVSPHVRRTAESLGVGILIQIPCKTNYIKEKLTDLVSSVYGSKPTILTRQLNTLGISKTLIGLYCQCR